MNQFTIKQLQINFLFVIILIVLSSLILIPLLSAFSTYNHEMAHVKALNKYGITASYQLNLNQYIKTFYKFQLKPYSAGTTYVKSEDLNKLTLEQKREVLMAGIKSDLIIIYLIAFLIILNTSLFFIFRSKKLIFHLFFINITLCLWLTILAWSTISNLSINGGDLSLLLIPD